ncbi:unnamed protein product, partial [Vitis vinifera]
MSMVCTHNHFFDGRRNFMRGYLNDKGLKKMLKRNKLRDKVMSAGFNTFLDDDRQISLGILTYWPDPLPKGWTLKKYSNGKVWAHNTRTGQTFRTKKDLLRYVHYAENVLPLFAKTGSILSGLLRQQSPI